MNIKDQAIREQNLIRDSWNSALQKAVEKVLEIPLIELYGLNQKLIMKKIEGLKK